MPYYDNQTIEVDGISFCLAGADGEVLDVRVRDREEFLECHGDRWEDREPSTAEILQYANRRLSKRAQAAMEGERMSLAEQYGVEDVGR